MPAPIMSGMNLLHIFKSGTRRDTTGRVVTITDDELKASAAAYDPAKHEAPIVIGHPDGDAPAYGWAKSLSFAEGDLNAEPTQVDPEFAKLFNAGRYKKFSASFYEPDSPSNPVPGVWYLRHIGTLGAQPPAVKGLRQASFAEGETGVVSFADWSMMNQASMWRRFREWLIADKGVEVADQVIPDYAINDLRDEGMRRDPPPVSSTPSFSETSVTPEQIAALQAENERLKKVAKDATDQEKQRAIAAVNTKNVAFAEAVIADGRLKPKHKDAVVAFLNFAEAPNVEGDVVSFGEGDAKQPLGTAFKSFLQDLDQVVSFSETAKKGQAIDASTNPLLVDAERRGQGTK